jgi:hypothetical protein
MPRLRKNVLGRAAFDNLPGIHHGHPVTHLGDNPEVMGDEDEGHVGLALQVFEKTEILGLDGDVKRGHWLVGQQQAGLAGDGNSSGHTLAHATAHLVGKGRDALLRSANADLLQQLDHAPPHLSTAQTAVQPQRLGNLCPNSRGRVERRHRVLEDHGNLRPTYLAHFLRTLVEEILSVKYNLSAYDAASRLREQAHDREAGQRLPGAGFPDNPERFATLYAKASAIDRLHHPTAGVYARP